MFNLKKIVLTYKLKKYLTTNTVVLFFHYNLISSQNWNLFKLKISKIKNIQTFLIRNSLSQNLLAIPKNDIVEKKMAISLWKSFIKNKKDNKNPFILRKNTTLTKKISQYTKYNVTKKFYKNPNIGLPPKNKKNIFYSFTEKISTAVYKKDWSKKKVLQKNTQNTYKNNKLDYWKYLITSKKNEKPYKELFLIQGSTLLISLNTTEPEALPRIKQILNLTKETARLFLIGAQIEKKWYNHLDLKKAINLYTQEFMQHKFYKEFLFILNQNNKELLRLPFKVKLNLVKILNYKLILLLIFIKKNTL